MTLLWNGATVLQKQLDAIAIQAWQQRQSVAGYIVVADRKWRDPG